MAALALSGGRVKKAIRLFHGTSLQKARNIERWGFAPSERGSLGRGVYLAPDREKALKFARSANWHGSCDGALIEVTVRIDPTKVKHAKHDDDTWQEAGYDACRARRTSKSSQPEWCLRNPKKIKVVRVEPVAAGVFRRTPRPAALPAETVSALGAGADSATSDAPRSGPERRAAGATAGGVLHRGVTCDASGGPIYGTRWHLAGENYDLCDVEFRKLDPDDQDRFLRVDRPQTFGDWFSDDDDEYCVGYGVAEEEEDAVDEYCIGYGVTEEEEDAVDEYCIGYAVGAFEEEEDDDDDAQRQFEEDAVDEYCASEEDEDDDYDALQEFEDLAVEEYCASEDDAGDAGEDEAHDNDESGGYESGGGGYESGGGGYESGGGGYESGGGGYESGGGDSGGGGYSDGGYSS
jgi:uncharacterized membrane protein YgcG